MSRIMFVNLPVQNLERSMHFFSQLDFEFNLDFTNELAACMIVNETCYVMLLSHEHFAGFTNKPISDATQSTEVLVAFSVNNREDVDDLMDRALSLGGVEFREAQDHGFMYGRSFSDPDGHIWELIWMDPNAEAED